MREALCGLLVAIALPLAACATASPPALTPLDYLPALHGDYFPLQSRAADHLYHIYIRYPEDYSKEPVRRYPIVYLLDGDSAFPLLAPQHLFIHYDDGLPEAIIVGIAYGSFASPQNRRHFDFSPPSGRFDEGGAPAFERFLRTELIPAVEARVRADSTRRVLVGQSRGGGFVLYSAFTDPDLFWARIASSPTLRPGRELYFGLPAPAVRRDLRLIVADGTRDDADLRPDTVAWQKAWQGRKTPWQVKTITLEGGSHSADLPNVYRQAMDWLFDKNPK